MYNNLLQVETHLSYFITDRAEPSCNNLLQIAAFRKQSRDNL